jgi:hypothetical protein
VITRGRKLGLLNALGRNLGTLAALFLRLGMPSFGGGLFPVFGLAACCLPAVNLPQAVRLLAIALVPAPCSELTIASLA